MSDDGVVADEKQGKKHRGRPAKNADAVKETKAESPKKRGRERKETKPAAAESGDEDGATVVKRGRGRPKGTTKKKSPAKKAKSGGGGGGGGGGRRGRPKKEEAKPDSAEEDAEENDAEEDEDDA